MAMRDVRFDFNNMFSAAVGREHGITEPELAHFQRSVGKAHAHLTALLGHPLNRVRLGLEWAVLPFQDKEAVRAVQGLGDEIGLRYENVVSLGIGGSYLGLKAAQEALCLPYYNEFPEVRRGRARIYFEGNNLDPTPLKILLEHLDPRKTFVVVISKSGETTETAAALALVEAWLKKGVGHAYGRQVVAITDPKSGTLRCRVREEQGRDPRSFRNLALLPGVGGRYSELNMGLLHLAIVGVDIKEVLAGARSMAERCRRPQLFENPACLYAALQALAYRRKGKPIAVLMPFTELLKSTADWYCQLLAESLGKKYGRSIKRTPDGLESWGPDIKHPLFAGRTPIASRGTTDLHSIQQNHIEGENNKTVTMVRIERFPDNLRVPASGGILSGRSLAELLTLAQEATEWALTRARRPNATIVLSELTPWTWGGLIYFFEMATAFEGEFLNVNAFDQPGVESYKNYMYHKLQKPGIPRDIVDDIRRHPVKKNKKFTF